ncbi:GNAT family N-acetyltransferase [candidate division KSB1 bacterium]|nr:GNAT family N-acetyltransferase [candidate division KSB1 bacterium]
MRAKVKVTYLEMNSISEYQPKKIDGLHLRVDEVKLPLPSYNKFLYIAVGSKWNWRDKLAWPDARWHRYVNMPELRTWVAYLEGTPCGYFELMKQHNGFVEIEYFGLLPQFIGRGLGGHLLSEAIEQSWGMGAKRIWLHTCDLDHPAALQNYLARGFKIYKTREEITTIPDPELNL